MKNYQVLIEAECWAEVDAENEQEAEIKAEEIVQTNFYAWDRITKIIMNKTDVDE